MDTRYDGPRRAPNRLVLYPCEHSRVTGELDALHLEWRLGRKRAVRAAGIHTVSDLIAFDHRAFWKKRLVLADIDPGALGKVINNRNAGTRSRSITPWDLRTGRAHLNGNRTIQELLDDIRGYDIQIRIERALVRLPIEPWLPPAQY
jgi:hypothetical protein